MEAKGAEILVETVCLAVASRYTYKLIQIDMPP